MAEFSSGLHPKDRSQLQDFLGAPNDERLVSRTSLHSRDWSLEAQQGDLPAHYEMAEKRGEKHEHGSCDYEFSAACQ